MPISFFSKSNEFKLDNESSIEEWLIDCITSETEVDVIEINVVFCTDEELLEINKSYLDHDFYTDIITFPIEQDDTLIEAELYLSIDRIKDNANESDVSFQNELNRVLVHGVLHLCGYGDKQESEVTEMRAKEEEYLSKLN